MSTVCGDFKPPCPSGFVCDYEAMKCGKGTLSGYCVAKPTSCPTEFAPVCGCDGKTYEGDCARLSAGAQLDHVGACAGSDGGAADASPISCGTMICGGLQVCVHPCCGGAYICDPPPDGGGCPSGSSPCIQPGGAPGCTHVCTPPPPYCLDMPASCGGTPTCSCLSGTTCCSGISGRVVVCACP